MQTDEFFDVLSIHDENENVDIIQSLMGDDCLGTYFDNGTGKLYFQSSIKNSIEKRLLEINSNYPFQWTWEKIKKEDWHLEWQENFQPVIIDDKLAVIPHWQNDSHKGQVIKIKPGMAFGTGHHETTWLMLSQMIKHIKLGISVLDLGTGSGILSIAAIKLGAEKVDGVEFDSACEINFKENLVINQVGNNINYHQQDVLTWNNFDYNLILANINSNVIKKLIPKLHDSRGSILLSGLLETDLDDIEHLCQKHHFQIKEKMIKGEWVCLSME